MPSCELLLIIKHAENPPLTYLAHSASVDVFEGAGLTVGNWFAELWGFVRATEEMQGGVVAMVAGSLVLGSPSVVGNINVGNNNARAPVAARKLACVHAMATWDARWETSGSLRVGRRVRGGRGESSVRVFALQQQSAKSVKWVLDPCGDGNTSHLDTPVPLPSGFELASDSVIVGRVKDRVDIVIPIATVSGVHARLEKRNGQLLLTDLDSTNGTFVNDKRIRPGAVTSVPPGSYITFGDEHLAVFRYLQLEEPEEAPAAEVPVEEQAQEQEAQAQ